MGGGIMKTKAVVVAFLLVFVAAPAGAQWGAQGTNPGLRGEFTPVLGAWAEYRIQGKGTPASTMKIAIVGKEGSAYWYETVTKTGGDSTVMKMLVSGDPNDQRAVKRMIVKHGTEQALEMPVTGQDQRPSPGLDDRGKTVDKGMETVRVPAGTFKARHVQYIHEKDTVDSWASEKVPPYNLVKSSAKDFEMVLTGYGMGAKTSITETPKPFQMPRMPSGMPKGMVPPGMKIPAGQ